MTADGVRKLRKSGGVMLSTAVFEAHSWIKGFISFLIFITLSLTKSTEAQGTFLYLTLRWITTSHLLSSLPSLVICHNVFAASSEHLGVNVSMRQGVGRSFDGLPRSVGTMNPAALMLWLHCSR